MSNLFILKHVLLTDLCNSQVLTSIASKILYRSDSSYEQHAVAHMAIIFILVTLLLIPQNHKSNLLSGGQNKKKTGTMVKSTKYI